MMDKGWIHFDRRTDEYEEAVMNFVKLAQFNTGKSKLRCPCKKCQNFRWGSGQLVKEHLIIHGMDMTYTIWFWHGESIESLKSGIDTSETHELCKAGNGDVFHGTTEEEMQTEFTEYVEKAELPLFQGCTKYTKLSATVMLYKLKVTHGLSNQGFDEFMELFKDMLPAEENTLPNSSYAVDALLKEFQLEEKKIDACVNDCCLFYKELEKHEICPKCKTSRWKKDRVTNKIKKGRPAKVLRYFPIIPRFKRMFQSSILGEQLQWHHNNKSEDGNMRHPVDSPAWDTIDKKWPEFAAEPRNLRLGLATDGINPFWNLSSTHSCWPVMLATYNLPPWLSIRNEHLMLSLLIPGPKQPGNDIDIYLQPLINYLKELWEKGVEVYDAFTKTTFNLKVILMWTINDFPAYGNLCGCTTKGKTACPVCGVNTCSTYLRAIMKTIYMDHRRFLPMPHPFRLKKSWFNGLREDRGMPPIMSGSDIFQEIRNFENDFGKGENKRKRQEPMDMWKKKSIFFDLPYWEHLLVRHNLDVMHIEKNVCESIIGTLLNVKGKSKDGLNARKALQKMGIRQDLHPKSIGNRTYLPTALHTLSKREKQILYKRLMDLKLPDGYSSNIRNLVSAKEFKISGLKSHDYHVLMQQLLSVALRGLLPKGPRNTIFKLCAFDNEICQKVINCKKLEELEKDVVETMCLLERFFPPSFFDIMIHLTIHLAREARLCGPVHARWMYVFERYMKFLKGFVRNKAKSEGSIAKCYLADECMRFCSSFIKQVAELNNKPRRNDTFGNDAIVDGRPISKRVSIALSDEKLEIAHRYVLFNTDEVKPYEQIHLNELKLQDENLVTNEGLLWKMHAESFSSWLKDKIMADSTNISETLKCLAFGPRNQASSYSGYVINGQRYHRMDVDNSNQNSGVSLEATTMSPIASKVTFMGLLKI